MNKAMNLARFLLQVELKVERLVEVRLAGAVLRPRLLLLDHAPRRAQLQHAHVRGWSGEGKSYILSLFDRFLRQFTTLELTEAVQLRSDLLVLQVGGVGNVEGQPLRRRQVAHPESQLAEFLQGGRCIVYRSQPYSNYHSESFASKEMPTKLRALIPRAYSPDVQSCLIRIIHGDR